MTLVEWKDEFKTGITALDYEHREMVNLLNRLYIDLAGDGSRENVVAFLGEVYARISAHFALEESIMRKAAYDDYAAHKAEHEALLDDIRDIMDDFSAGQFRDYRRALADAVRDWFVNHFKTRDARLHKMLGV